MKAWGDNEGNDEGNDEGESKVHSDKGVTMRVKGNDKAVRITSGIWNAMNGYRA